MAASLPDYPCEASPQGALNIDRGKYRGPKVEVKNYFSVEGLGMLAKKGAWVRLSSSMAFWR
jgi:hypothetical protein